MFYHRNFIPNLFLKPLKMENYIKCNFPVSNPLAGETTM